MDPKRLKLYDEIKKRGLTAERDQKILSELYDEGTHDLPDALPDIGRAGIETFSPVSDSIYAYNDLSSLQGITALQSTYNISLRPLDELLEKDKQREKDGFPRKINVGRLIKPGKGGKDKVVVVPTTVEEKFFRQNFT